MGGGAQPDGFAAPRDASQPSCCLARVSQRHQTHGAEADV